MNTKSLILMLILLIATMIEAQIQVIIPDTLSGTKFNLNLQNGKFEFYASQTTKTLGVNGGDILNPHC